MASAPGAGPAAGIQAQAFQALLEIAGAIGTALDPRAVAKLAAERVRVLLGVDAASLWQWEPDLEVLRMLARSDSLPHEWAEEARPGESIVGQTLLRRAAVVVEDYQSWKFARPSMLRRGVASAAGVPLLVDDRAIGSLVAISYTRHAFEAPQVQLLSLLASQVAPALEAARLYVAAERRRIEAEALAMSLAEGVCAADAKGRVIFANPAAAKLLGAEPAELIGRDLHEVLHPGCSTEPCPLAGVLSVGAAARVEDTTLWRLDGCDFPADWSASAIIADGRPSGMVVAFRDVTARRRNEDRIRALNVELERRVVERTAELQAANDELQAFCYSVSHDLRTPLRSVDGFCQVLLEDYGDRLDELGRSYLRRARSASQRMAEIIDDLLGLSRLSRARLRRQVVDVSKLARSVAGDLQATEPSRQVTFEIAAGLSAQADARLLRLVLENLLGNAWKFTAKHATARIEVGATDRDGKRVFFVRDDGAGFDMAYASKLFGPFQRLHRADEFDGTGIGLATVQRIINRHGGRVWAEGEVERGACFYFSL